MKKMFLVITVLGLLGVVSSHAATLTAVHTFGPDTVAFTTDAVEKLVSTGTLPSGNPTSPSDSRRLGISISPEHVMVKSDGNGFIWLGVILTAGANETVALADITTVLSDGGNLLGKTTAFSQKSYSLTAPGVRKDQSRITSGSPTQGVDGKVVVLVGYKSFPVNSPADDQAVRNWFYTGNNGVLTSFVTGKEATTTVVIPRRQPLLIPSIVDGRLTVIAENNGDPRNHEVLVSSMFTGPWTNTSLTIRAGGPRLYLNLVNDFPPTRYVRLAPAP